MRTELDLAVPAVSTDDHDSSIINSCLRQQHGLGPVEEALLTREHVDTLREEELQEIDNPSRRCKNPVMCPVVDGQGVDLRDPHFESSRQRLRLSSQVLGLSVSLVLENGLEVFEPKPNARGDRLARITAEKHVIFVVGHAHEES